MIDSVSVRSVTRQQLTGASVERNRIVEKSIRILSQTSLYVLMPGSGHFLRVLT